MTDWESLGIVILALSAGFLGGYSAHCYVSAGRYRSMRGELRDLEERVYQRMVHAERLHNLLQDDYK